MLRRILFMFILGAGTSWVATAQETVKDSVWTLGGNAGLKLTQVSFSNWATGGENAVAFDLQGAYEADYKKGKHLWRNRLELAYGLNKNKGEGTKKTSDKIYLNSNYGYEVYKNLYVSALLNYQSQFSPGYDYAVDRHTAISRFMAPGYLMTGLGITWTPVKYFTATFTPATWRGTFVLDKTLRDQGAFGVKDGKKLLSEFGANLKLEAKYEFMKNMTVYSRLDLYSDYLRKPQNVDVNWEVQINMVINKWFSANITTNMVYDDDVKILQKNGTRGARLQFKELLGVGLQYNF
ncbi:DUF3078 domain-containing protein [Coprobacter tertius]|uniref:DUF3078 domain-containing protein n=1 Tax=Coprobacter tertius TaxID=2944915 RepID=A0ABT1MKP2_9BACT|nr:DUF3078 domain-containing protein [Coprobacter tertius]MCP9612278.1 DUF3078 domain-containing protein [Coprobacter tertius]